MAQVARLCRLGKRPWRTNLTWPPRLTGGEATFEVTFERG
jgi:hypothetical protein